MLWVGPNFVLTNVSYINYDCVLNIRLCDRLQENPAYGIYTQLAQCAFLKSQVSICQTLAFVYSYSETFLQLATITYEG